MEFRQELETGLLKQIGNTETTLKIKEVASKCRLLKTDNGIKVELSYTGPNASKYLQYVEKHREELTNYLLHPDDADLYEWMETSHQSAISLKKHEKENVTMKLGAPLMKANIQEMTRSDFKLAVYDMLLLADEIAIQMGNEELRKMANIEMVKNYLSEIYDKFHDATLGM